MTVIVLLFYSAALISFFFPWLFLHTLMRMIRNEKYGYHMFFTCICFGIMILGILCSSQLN